MMTFELERAAQLTGGMLHPAGAASTGDVFRGLSVDSRTLRPGNLYVAMIGQRVDGHRFLDEVADAGAAAALVSRFEQAPIAQIQVPDVVRAMGELARAWRAGMPARVVGVTGSNGKTTVKTMLAAILSRSAATLATRGNYNNEIGVPLTLAALAERHRFAVVEMGCGQAGDIAWLASIAAPDIGLVTNAGPAHLERLGSLEGVAAAKGELFQSLAADGIAVINRDDRFYDFWCGLAGPARILSFGRDVRADVRLNKAAAVEWVETPNGRFELEMKLPGEHNRSNALAATAAAVALGIDLDTIRAGLASTELLPGRLTGHAVPGGWTLIDDSYNANPASVSAALSVLAAAPSPKVLVLGDMAELGPNGEELHRQIGREARRRGIDRLLAFGPGAALAAEAFGGGECFGSRDALVEGLQAMIEPGLTCLVKGSRSMAMDRVVAALLETEVPPC